MASVDRRQALLGAALASAAATFASASPIAFPLTRVGDRLFLRARMNDVETAALLDSAAETSLVAPRFAARLTLKPGESTAAHGSGAAAFTAKLVEHVRIDAAGVTVADATVAVVDLSDVGRRLIGRPIDLVVGREIFDAAWLVIDIAGLTIGRMGVGAAPRGIELPLVEARGVMGMPVTIEATPTAGAEFDLGNGTGVLLSRAFAARAGLSDGRPLTTALGGGLGGAKPRTGLMLESLTLAGRRFEALHADIDDAPDAPDANIGVGLLQHFRITCDFSGRRLWLESI